jgi:hypothetical protein
MRILSDIEVNGLLEGDPKWEYHHVQPKLLDNKHKQPLISLLRYYYYNNGHKIG